MQNIAANNENHSPLSELIAQQGSHSHALWHVVSEEFSSLDPADIGDIAHFFCILHGRHPGVIDLAANRSVDGEAREWLVNSMNGFSAERAFLTRLTVAAGPIQGITAADDSSTAIHAHGRALELLAQSDRRGTAIGAAFALVLEWHGIRQLLDNVAMKVGVEPRDVALPTAEDTISLANILCNDPTVERAMTFGAKQLLHQHRGVWDLLAARRNGRAEF